MRGTAFGADAIFLAVSFAWYGGITEPRGFHCVLTVLRDPRTDAWRLAADPLPASGEQVRHLLFMRTELKKAAIRWPWPDRHAHEEGDDTLASVCTENPQDNWSVSRATHRAMVS
jgi:hypothetical protein